MFHFMAMAKSGRHPPLRGTWRLVIPVIRDMLRSVKGKLVLPIALMLVFALTRIPGVFPEGFENFSAAYALAFCAGVYFTGAMAWWLPLGVLLLTDIGLNCYYYFHLHLDVWSLPVLKSQLFNYAAFGVLILLGRRFKPQSSFLGLLGGGILGALLFYVITNTVSWLFNPFSNVEYSKTWLGWLTALIKGTAGWPPTWVFFRNTLLSGGLFTALFVGAAKLSEAAESPLEKEAGATAEAEPDAEEVPEEAQA
jgi:hypothetical protein